VAPPSGGYFSSNVVLFPPSSLPTRPLPCSIKQNPPPPLRERPEPLSPGPRLDRRGIAAYPQSPCPAGYQRRGLRKARRPPFVALLDLPFFPVVNRRGMKDFRDFQRCIDPMAESGSRASRRLLPSTVFHAVDL